MEPARKTLIYSCLAFAVLTMVLFCHRFVHAAELPSPGGTALLAKYPAIRTKLLKNQFGIPLYLESREDHNSLHVHVYGIFEYSFDSVRDALQSPANWCDLNLLLFNIKACTFRKTADQWLLTLYSGRKYYQPPKDTFKLDFRFRIAARQPEYLAVELIAKQGPLLTRDHQVRIEAAPLDRARTLFHFSYNYRYGLMARAAIKSYFATIGRDKKGFSIIATDRKGDPVYLGGARGSVERNAVRYYLALQTFMDTVALPVNQRFEKRISRWYDLTARFPQQLYEMDKGAYLANKRREHANQLKLQKEAGN